MISGSAWRKGAVRTRLVGEGRWAPGAGQSDMCSTDHNQAASGRSASKLFIGQAEAPDVSIALSSYPVRSPLFNLIMYGRDGLAGSERELGAVAASVANRCVYCAAVRASRFNNLTKRMDVIEAVFADGLEATLDEHLQAIFDFSAHLSTTPPEATAADAQALVDVGLSELECLDLIQSAATFGWANRLEAAGLQA
jgi:uncharacterized peroxidase-related enzyme